MRNAANYLSSYTGVVGTRWRKFGATLEDVAHMPEIANRIVDAANEAFRCQRRWIQQDRQATRVAI
jgi:heme oxygenase